MQELELLPTNGTLYVSGISALTRGSSWPRNINYLVKGITRSLKRSIMKSTLPIQLEEMVSGNVDSGTIALLGLDYARLVCLTRLGLDGDVDVVLLLQLVDHRLVHIQALGKVKHHDNWQRAEKKLTRKVDIVDGARDGHRPLLDWGNVGVASIREYDHSVGALHHNLQVDVALAKDGGVVLGADLHQHDNWDRGGEAGAEVVHEEQGGLFDPRAFPLTTFDHNSCRVEVLLLLTEHDLDIVLVLRKGEVLKD